MAEGGWRLGHRPALDGLRGVAVLAVMCAHAGIPGFHRGGSTGVVLFFVLSGFLITSLLLEEAADHDRISLGRFFARRFLRLLPPLLFLVGILLATGIVSVGQAAWSLSYIANWHAVDGGDLGYLAHTWSLAIEEQFYLVLPLLVVLLRRRPTVLGAVLATGATASALAREVLITDGDHGYYGTDARLDALLLGALLAVAFSHRGAVRIPAPALGLASAALAAATVGIFGPGSGFTTDALLCGVLVAAGAATTWVGPNWLRRVGARSYALYLWHVPVMWFTAERVPYGWWDAMQLPFGPLRVVATFALSFFMAEVSWVLVEEPCRGLRSRVASRPALDDRVGDLSSALPASST